MFVYLSKNYMTPRYAALSSPRASCTEHVALVPNELSFLRRYGAALYAIMRSRRTWGGLFLTDSEGGNILPVDKKQIKITTNHEAEYPRWGGDPLPRRIPRSAQTSIFAKMLVWANGFMGSIFLFFSTEPLP